MTAAMQAQNPHKGGFSGFTGVSPWAFSEKQAVPRSLEGGFSGFTGVSPPGLFRKTGRFQGLDLAPDQPTNASRLHRRT